MVSSIGQRHGLCFVVSPAASDESTVPTGQLGDSHPGVPSQSEMAEAKPGESCSNPPPSAAGPFIAQADFRGSRAHEGPLDLVQLWQLLSGNSPAPKRISPTDTCPAADASRLTPSTEASAPSGKALPLHVTNARAGAPSDVMRPGEPTKQRPSTPQGCVIQPTCLRSNVGASKAPENSAPCDVRVGERLEPGETGSTVHLRSALTKSRLREGCESAEPQGETGSLLPQCGETTPERGPPPPAPSSGNGSDHLDALHAVGMRASRVALEALRRGAPEPPKETPMHAANLVGPPATGGAECRRQPSTPRCRCGAGTQALHRHSSESLAKEPKQLLIQPVDPPVIEPRQGRAHTASELPESSSCLGQIHRLQKPVEWEAPQLALSTQGRCPALLKYCCRRGSLDGRGDGEGSRRERRSPPVEDSRCARCRGASELYGHGSPCLAALNPAVEAATSQPPAPHQHSLGGPSTSSLRRQGSARPLSAQIMSRCTSCCCYPPSLLAWNQQRFEPACASSQNTAMCTTDVGAR